MLVEGPRSGDLALVLSTEFSYETLMHFKVLPIIAILIPAAAFSAPAPTPNLNHEYEQVRLIALRDPKVKAAFEEANRKLEAKIVEIDPALKGYTKGQPLTTTRINSTNAAPVKAKPFVPPSKPKAVTAHTTTHVIATGDTLSSIAAKYKITVAQLKAANPTVDEKKLQVTEKLVIPAGHGH